MTLTRFLRRCLWIIPVAFCVGLLCWPSEVANSVKESLLLCGNLVVPAIFPFFVLSALTVSLGIATRMGHLLSGFMRTVFHQEGASASALVLGFLGGYPVGGKTVCSLYQEGLCDRRQAEHLLMFCNNAEPSFVLGAAGGAIFHSTSVGFFLLITQILSALTVGVFFRPPKRLRGTVPERRKTDPSFSFCMMEAIQDSAGIAVHICTFVLFFNVVLSLLRCCGFFSICQKVLSLVHCPTMWQEALLFGFFELSNGVSFLPNAVDGWIPAAFLLSWGGLSVHLQTISFLVNTGLRIRPYLCGKLLQSALSAVFVCLFLQWFPSVKTAMVSAVSSGVREQSAFSTGGLASAAAMLLALILLNGFLRQKTLEKN